MPLSEHEQRILDEIERNLAKDPKFARDVSVATPYGKSLRRLKRAIAGFALGFVLLIVTLVAGLKSPSAFLLIGLPAFVVMLASAVSVATSAKHIGRERASAASKQQQLRWFGKMEERWRKRFDKDDG